MKISSLYQLVIGVAFAALASGCGESCPDSLDACGIGCFDLENDEKHCGKCGVACGEREVCIEGECVCRSNATLCEDECVNTDLDERHCGECFNECPEEEVCISGECGLCEDLGAVKCGDVCKNIHFNPHDCGSCGHGCSEDEICIYGECVTGECEEFGFSTWCILDNCLCFDTNDPISCGERDYGCRPEKGVCVDDSCQAGTCEDFSLTTCPFWYLTERYMCVDTMTDILSCGGCYNACEVGQSCVDGMCQ